MGSVYERLVTAGPRKTQPRYTAIVSIKTGPEPESLGTDNICTQRKFLAQLIKRIAIAQPSVVAIDKYFGKDTCHDDPAATDALIEAIDTAQRAGVPIMVGRIATEDGRLVPSLSFDHDGNNRRPSEALLNLHPDERRLAFTFKVSDESHPAIQRMDTLAHWAAFTHNPTLFADNEKLERFYADYTYPYVGFIRTENFKNHLYSAIDVLCGNTNRLIISSGTRASRDWRSCDPASEDRRSIEGLRGRIIIVGEDNEFLDQHDSVIGRVPGLVLQANYVEALLDERVYPTLPWMNYLAGLLIFLAFEAGLLAESFAAPVLVTGGVLALSVGVGYLSVHLLGFFFNPVSVSLLAIFVRLAAKWSERFQAAFGEKPDVHGGVAPDRAL